MIHSRWWLNRNCNKQVGNTCGFYALAFIYGMICEDKRFGRKAAFAAKDALLNQRSFVGEILSIYQLLDEWNLNFNKLVVEYGYTASVVSINSASDIYNLLDKNSYIVLPITLPNNPIPCFEVLYGDTAFTHCWEPAFGTKYSFSIATEFLFNKKNSVFCNFACFDFNDKPSLYIRNHLRNFSLARTLVKCRGRASRAFSAQSCLPANLNGHCLLVRKTVQNLRTLQ